jgi:hypothetical protein
LKQSKSTQNVRSAKLKSQKETIEAGKGTLYTTMRYSEQKLSSNDHQNLKRGTKYSKIQSGSSLPTGGEFVSNQQIQYGGEY